MPAAAIRFYDGPERFNLMPFFTQLLQSGCGVQDVQRRPSFSSGDVREALKRSLQALFSLKGYALMRLADGVMLAERWGRFRQLDTLAQAAQFLQQIGGSNGRT